MTVLSATWSLTVGGVSGLGLRIEPSCLSAAATGIDAETGAEVRGGSLYASEVVNAVVGARSTAMTGTILGGEILRKYEVILMECQRK